MRRCALVGPCIAMAALAAGGAALGGDRGAPGGGETQRQGWSLPPLPPAQRRHLIADAIQTPVPTAQVAEDTDIEQQATATELGESVFIGGVQAPVTFYACHGPNGGYCAGAAGPLPLAEGQAACGEAWPLGSVVVIEGDPLGAVICNDRGWLAPYQVDRFFWEEGDGWAWSAQIGGYARVERVGTRPSAPRGTR